MIPRADHLFFLVTPGVTAGRGLEPLEAAVWPDPAAGHARCNSRARIGTPFEQRPFEHIPVTPGIKTKRGWRRNFRSPSTV